MRPDSSVLTSSTVKKLTERFRGTGSLGETRHHGGPKRNRSNINIKAVRQKTQKHQFGIVDKICKFQKALYSVFSLNIWMSLLQIAVNSLIEAYKWILIF